MCLKNDQGNWIDDQREISECFINFYKDLFAGSGPRNFEPVLSYVDPVITEADNLGLMAPVREEEI